MIQLNASARILAYRMASDAGQRGEYSDLDDVAHRLDGPADKPFTYKRVFKNVLELAPILQELAGAFRTYGFHYTSGTSFKDHNWNADVNLNGKALVVQFKPA